MADPTDDSQAPQPPRLLGYETWTDETGFHARPSDAAPGSQEIHAATALGLTQEAVRARVRRWRRETRRVSADEEIPFRTGDLA